MAVGGTIVGPHSVAIANIFKASTYQTKRRKSKREERNTAIIWMRQLKGGEGEYPNSTTAKRMEFFAGTGPLVMGPLRIFTTIRGDIHNFVFITCIIDTSD